mmetsp:Transcript_4009/g.12443  ORF Transcript_4009/g.12443 Transcript_4009/m.12443 type:complete len:221 (-) Transcript_4009:503-1165(-)
MARSREGTPVAHGRAEARGAIGGHVRPGDVLFGDRSSWRCGSHRRPGRRVERSRSFAGNCDRRHDLLRRRSARRPVPPRHRSRGAVVRLRDVCGVRRLREPPPARRAKRRADSSAVSHFRGLRHDGRSESVGLRLFRRRRVQGASTHENLPPASAGREGFVGAFLAGERRRTVRSRRPKRRLPPQSPHHAVLRLRRRLRPPHRPPPRRFGRFLRGRQVLG